MVKTIEFGLAEIYRIQPDSHGSEASLLQFDRPDAVVMAYHGASEVKFVVEGAVRFNQATGGAFAASPASAAKIALVGKFNEETYLGQRGATTAEYRQFHRGRLIVVQP